MELAKGRRSVLRKSLLEWYHKHPDCAERVAMALGTANLPKKKKKRKRTGNKSPPRLSLRLMEFFIHNFLEKCQDEDFGGVTGAELLYSYRKQLRALGKANFDVFCRKNKMEFKFGSVVIQSNPPQLEFFRWAVSGRALEVAQQNIERLLALRQLRKQQKGHGAEPEETADGSLDTRNGLAVQPRRPGAELHELGADVGVVSQLELHGEHQAAVHGAQGRPAVQGHGAVVQVPQEPGHELNDPPKRRRVLLPPGIRGQG